MWREDPVDSVLGAEAIKVAGAGDERAAADGAVGQRSVPGIAEEAAILRGAAAHRRANAG